MRSRWLSFKCDQVVRLRVLGRNSVVREATVNSLVSLRVFFRWGLGNGLGLGQRLRNEGVSVARLNAGDCGCLRAFCGALVADGGYR